MTKTAETAEFSAADIKRATAIVEHFTTKMLDGDRRAIPYELYKAIMRATVQPAIEAVIIDRNGRYCLHRRPPTEKFFGAGRLHILGGFMKPVGDLSASGQVRWMARHECGFEDVKYIAGPIAVYNWLPGEHPLGWPRSEVYVFRTVVGNIPEREDLAWFDVKTLPSEDEIIIGRAGELHLQFLHVFQQWYRHWRQDEMVPCIDLNAARYDLQHPAD